MIDAAFAKAINVPSAAILFSNDTGAMPGIVGALRTYDWQMTITADVDAALSAATPDMALVLLDAATGGAVDFLERLRGYPQPIGGVPVLQYGGARLFGVSAMLPEEDAEIGLSTVERFTGPLGDHAMRHPPLTPFYRLTRLVGIGDAATMIDRFADSLQAMLAQTAPAREEKHRLAGLAGAIGYGDLGVAWRDAEHGGADAEAVAIAATRATLAEIERHNLARYRPPS